MALAAGNGIKRVLNERGETVGVDVLGKHYRFAAVEEEEEDDLTALFPNAAPPERVKQEDDRVRREMPKSSFIPPFYVFLYLGTAAIVLSYSGVIPSWYTASLLNNYVPTGAISYSVCPGHTAGMPPEQQEIRERIVWERLKQPQTGTKVPQVGTTAIKLGILGSSTMKLETVVSALVYQLLLQQNVSMVCMHEYASGTAAAQVCVLRRSAGGQMTPMINPDLKGYSDEAASTVVDEKSDSVFCLDGGAKRRRNLVDVEYTTLSGHRMRTLLEDKEEAFAFQRLWDEMRGTYLCEK
jgi:hypothetical protein